jgi:hypothetical protein
MAAVVGSLFVARERAARQLATPESVSQWQAWREDVRRQQIDRGPVQRRVPKSTEPPALVLMRDYFTVCVAGAILFVTVLYWVTAWFISGILKGDVGGTSDANLHRLHRPAE